MNPVLVSFASKGREDYLKAQLSLIDSAKGTHNHTRNWYGEYLFRAVDGYCGEYKCVKIQLGSYPVTEKYGVSWQHSDMPYQFKPYAIQEARDKGYTKILWCDSTMRINKNPYKLFEKCSEIGILAFDNLGHPLENWISDYSVKWCGLDSVKGMKQIMACVIFFDFDHPKCVQVFDEWIKGSQENCFHPSTEASQRPEYKGSRHDQALLSALMNKHDISIQDYGEVAYRHYQPIEPYILAWGVND